MTELIYRNSMQSDLEEIVRIYNSTVASRMVTADTDPVIVEDRQAWFDQHNHTDRPLWVIENREKQILGWISFQSFYGRPAYNSTVEISIYLDEGQRGKGLGKLALQYCIDQAQKLSIKTLLGFIFSHNEPSLRLFKSYGFQEWGNLPDIALLDGIERGLKILGKRIA